MGVSGGCGHHCVCKHVCVHMSSGSALKVSLHMFLPSLHPIHPPYLLSLPFTYLPPSPPLASYSENTVTVVAYTSAGPGEQAMVMFRTREDSE